MVQGSRGLGIYLNSGFLGLSFESLTAAVENCVAANVRLQFDASPDEHGTP